MMAPLDAKVSVGAVCLARLTGGPVHDGEARGVLEAFGAIEETAPVSVADQEATGMPEGIWVKFRYWNDCKDAMVVSQKASPSTHQCASSLTAERPFDKTNIIGFISITSTICANVALRQQAQVRATAVVALVVVHAKSCSKQRLSSLAISRLIPPKPSLPVSSVSMVRSRTFLLFGNPRPVSHNHQHSLIPVTDVLQVTR